VPLLNRCNGGSGVINLSCFASNVAVSSGRALASETLGNLLDHFIGHRCGFRIRIDLPLNEDSRRLLPQIGGFPFNPIPNSENLWPPDVDGSLTIQGHNKVEYQLCAVAF
jgi:hypothetical protein